MSAVPIAIASSSSRPAPVGKGEITCRLKTTKYLVEAGKRVEV